MKPRFWTMLLGVIFFARIGDAGDVLPPNTLELKKNEGNDELIELIRRFPRTQWLHLDGSKVTDGGLVHLKLLSDLCSLELDRTQITKVAREHLKELPKLERLRIEGCTDSDLIPIKGLQKIRFLDLGYTAVGDEGLVHLAGFANLETLSLTNAVKVGDAGLAHLGRLDSLRSLSVDHTAITDKGVVHLTKLKNLERLDLGRTEITNAGLTDLKPLTNLQVLNISHTRVSDAGLDQLKDLVGLRQLDLYRLKISDQGLDQLEGLTKLNRLGLTGTLVSDQGVATLKSKLPSLVSVWR